VSVEPTPDPDPFDRNDCSLILFEIGFCKDLGCQEKLIKKTEKYHPSFALYDDIGEASTSCASPSATPELHSVTPRPISRPPSSSPPLHRRQTKTKKPQDTRNNKTTLTHDKRIAKSLLDKFNSLAQTRLLGIIAHIQ
jgi:hypothetical protein